MFLLLIIAFARAQYGQPGRVIILTDSGLVDTDKFSELHLFDEPFQLAVPKDEHIAQQSIITLAELRKREILLLEEGHCLRGQALDVCFMAGARENVGFHASSLETLRHMVGEEMAITLMPQLAIPARGRSPRIKMNILISG